MATTSMSQPWVTFTIASKASAVNKCALWSLVPGPAPPLLVTSIQSPTPILGQCGPERHVGTHRSLGRTSTRKSVMPWLCA